MRTIAPKKTTRKEVRDTSDISTVANDIAPPASEVTP